MECYEWNSRTFNTLRPRQNGRHSADDIFKCIFLNENVWTPIKISMKFVPKGPINIIPALVQIMAWRRPGDKPLSEPMMVSLTTHICVTRPQWVNEKVFRVSVPTRQIVYHQHGVMPLTYVNKMLHVRLKSWALIMVILRSQSRYLWSKTVQQRILNNETYLL